jgi:hypothetical protein
VERLEPPNFSTRSRLDVVIGLDVLLKLSSVTT